MKTILLLLTLFVSFNIMANSISFTVPNSEKNIITMKEVCLGGYVYVVTVSPAGAGWLRSVSTVQVMKKANLSTILIPVTCR